MNNRHVFLTVLETGKFKIKRPAELVLVRTHFLFYRTSCCILTCRKGLGSSVWPLLKEY